MRLFTALLFGPMAVLYLSVCSLVVEPFVFHSSAIYRGPDLIPMSHCSSWRSNLSTLGFLSSFIFFFFFEALVPRV